MSVSTTIATPDNAILNYDKIRIATDNATEIFRKQEAIKQELEKKKIIKQAEDTEYKNKMVRWFIYGIIAFIIIVIIIIIIILLIRNFSNNSPQQQSSIYSPQQMEQPSIFNPQPQIFNPQPQIFNPQPQIFKPQQEIFKPQQEIFKPRQEIFKPQQEIFKPRQEIFKPQQEIFKPQQSSSILFDPFSDNTSYFRKSFSEFDTTETKQQLKGGRKKK
jgi:hypothetical protein